MRIKSWVVTGAATVLAAAALGIIVAANDPIVAEQGVRVLFWASLALTFWGVWTTLLLMARLGLAQGLWCGLVLAGGTIAVAAVWHAGHRDLRLLSGLVFATLCLSFFIWHRLRGRT